MSQKNLFQFKQFTIDQSGCAMKVNTDGVLLGAFVQADSVEKILDIGTGTGVIALMLAQRFGNAVIDAVEVDVPAAETAERNFANAAFSNKPNVYKGSFQAYFAAHPDNVYHLIVTNPPFYSNSLGSLKKQMVLAKHADVDFFRELMECVAGRLTCKGEFWLILPLPTAQLVKRLAPNYSLFLSKTISIRSFAGSEPHREIVVLSRGSGIQSYQTFVIYRQEKVYSDEYRDSLKEYLTIF